MNFDIGHALLRLYPGARFVLAGYDYEGLDWQDDTIPKPSRSELENELVKIRQEHAATEYQRQREEEYPDKESLLIALWELVVEGRNTPAEELQALRKEIKAKYPKPEVSR
jgi:hypothetical protein